MHVSVSVNKDSSHLEAVLVVLEAAVVVNEAVQLLHLLVLRFCPKCRERHVM